MKQIDNFPGYYATESGRILSGKSGELLCLAPKTQNGGYQLVTLSLKGKAYTRSVHRLVAEAFIDNPLNLPEVNHVDGDKKHNAAINLEWCDRSSNVKHSYDIGLREHQRTAVAAANTERCSVAVIGERQSSAEVLRFPSMSAAKSAGFDHSKISLCVSGKRKSHGGYTWRLAA
jgi:hypothetical protein